MEAICGKRVGEQEEKETGNKGLSIIELMVAVAILSLAIVMIYESFFTCINVFSYCLNYLNLQPWMNEKIWEMQDELICSENLTIEESSGSFVERNKNFYWEAAVDLIARSQKSCLYKLSLTVSWKQAQRTLNLSQTAYVGN